jgi:hypothetical protein
LRSGDRLLGSISFPYLDALRFDLICPGEHEPYGESEEHQDNDVWTEGSQPQGIKDDFRSAQYANADYHINPGHTSDLPPLQFSQEQRELGCHADGSGRRKPPGPAQLATKTNNVMRLRRGQGG